MKSALGPSAPTSFLAQSTLPLYCLMPPLPSICKRVFTTSIGIVTAEWHRGALGAAVRDGGEWEGGALVSATQEAKPPYASPFHMLSDCMLSEMR